MKSNPDLFLKGDFGAYIVLGGPKSTVLSSGDRGETWEIKDDIPIMHGEESMGIFSVDFKNEFDGIMVGGDFRGDDLTVRGLNAAVTSNGGSTWTALDADKSPGN